MARDCAPIPWRPVHHHAHANISSRNDVISATNNNDYYDDDEDGSINPRQVPAGSNPMHGNEEMRASKEKSSRLSPAEKEKTKLRERQRRAITSRILGGLRKYGGYNLPPRADINHVLKALANEAGWVVESDGTTYRAQSGPPQSDGGRGARQTAKGSVTGGAVYGAMASVSYEGECSTTVSPARRQPDSNSSSLSLLRSSLSAPFAEADNNGVVNNNYHPRGLLSPGFPSCCSLPPPAGGSIAEPPGSGAPFYAHTGALRDPGELNAGRMIHSVGEMEMSGVVLNSAAHQCSARFLPPLAISPLLVFPRHGPAVLLQEQQECGASNANTPRPAR